MRIAVTHETVYRYAAPVRSLIQLLRVTPRPHSGQQVIQWRVSADADVRLRAGEDAYGNILHCLQIERPVERLTVRVTGEVATENRAGVADGCVERLPPGAYLRATDRTRADAAIADLARAADPGPEAGEVARAHALMGAVADRIGFEVGATGPDTTAAQALALGRGVCQDLAHVLIAAARTRGLPARYVSGHLLRGDGEDVQEAAHAWAELWLGALGWVGFDPANRVCPTDAYVRVAIGLDYLDAAPVRGSREGGGAETLTVKVHVRPCARFQAQGPGWQVQTLGGMTQRQMFGPPGAAEQ